MPPKLHKFNLILRTNRRATKKWFIRLVLAPIVVGVIVKLLSHYDVHAAIRAIAFILFLIVLSVAVLTLSYVMRLMFTNRNRLELNEEGLFDQASFCELGFVPMSAIANIQFAWLFDREFLVVEFLRSENPLKRRRGVGIEIYRFLFGRNLWVPLYLFKASRVDLESQLIHLGHLVKGAPPKPQQHPKVIQKRPDPPPLEAELPPEIPLSDEETKTRDFDTGIANRNAISASEVPVLNLTSNPEKQRVIEQVNDIKNKVRESGLDNKLAMLFFDHVAMFPALAANSKTSLPEGVSDVKGHQVDADYEEVSFLFHGEQLTFGLRRDIGESDEALLSFAVHGKVQSSVRVRVEIGELVPIELESFLAGAWQELVDRLIKAIEDLEASRRGGEVDLTDPLVPVSGDATKTSATSLTELKNRFGIKE